MKRKNFLLKAMSLGLALTLTCSIIPMQNLRAEELEKGEEQEKEKLEEESGKEEQESREETEEIIPEVIEIHNTDEFLKFAGQCFIDSWSADKKVLLAADIDLTGTDFQAIPVFSVILRKTVLWKIWH